MGKSKSRSRRKWIVFSVMGLGLAGLAAFAVLRKREVVITVQTEPVARRNLTELVVANGKIQPVVQVVINPEVSGEIIELPVKEGQLVHKGDLLVKIKPDNYIASTNLAEAAYLSALAAKDLSQANLDKARLEYERNQTLHASALISDSALLEAKTLFEVAKANFESSSHQIDQAKASLARALDDLSKTTIVSPITGTITKLKSQRGERVVGTAMMAGTEIMTIANLDDMEARVDIGETDVVLIDTGQHARLEVDAFRDCKFTGTVTDIANSAKSAGQAGSSQEATKFEVKIAINEKEAFRPGMSVTAEIETRYRSNVLTVPIQSVTTRLPKPTRTNGPVARASANSTNRADLAATTNSADSTNAALSTSSKKSNEPPKPIEVAFVRDGDHVKMVPVKRGISDDSYVEIVEGLKEGDQVVTGSYKAINRELEDGKKIVLGPTKAGSEKKVL